MLQILQAMLQQYVNREFSDVQAVFRKGRGNRDQIANISWKSKAIPIYTFIYLSIYIYIYIHIYTHIHFCFIDYDITFECVDHNKLWNILEEMELSDHLSCLLRNLYAGQDTTVRTGHGTTDWLKIRKGICQGCILSSCLFNLYAEYII